MIDKGERVLYVEDGEIGTVEKIYGDGTVLVKWDNEISGGGFSSTEGEEDLLILVEKESKNFT